MGVMQMIAEAKAKFHKQQFDVQKHKLTQEKIKVTNETKEKQELYRIQKEIETMKNSKAQRLYKPPENKLRSAAIGLAKVLDDKKKEREKQGYSSPFSTRSPSSNGPFSNSTFGQQQAKPKEIPKQKTVTIKMS